MLHLIGKNLWARRYRNGWLLAELIIVSMVIWVLTDPIVVPTLDRGHVLPMYAGFFLAFATMKMSGMKLCSLETTVRFEPVHGAVR